MPEQERPSLPGLLVIVVAGLASVATSPARWQVTAPPTTMPPPTPGKATLLVVESSHPPSFSIERAGHALSAPQPAAGTKRQELLLLNEYKFNLISIGDRCTSGGCFDKCEAPPGAFVRVTSADPVSIWERTIESSPATARLAPGVAQGFTVQVDSPELIELEVIAASKPAGYSGPAIHRQPPPSVGASPSTHAFTVSWYPEANASAAPTSVAWTARVREVGVCRGAGPCAPKGAAPQVLVKATGS